MSSDERRANDLAQMKGTSSWLTTLALKTEHYDLNKREFHDGIRLRHRWPLKYLPTTCVCGKGFSSDHTMSCAKGRPVTEEDDRIESGVRFSCDISGVQNEKLLHHNFLTWIFKNFNLHTTVVYLM